MNKMIQYEKLTKVFLLCMVAFLFSGCERKYEMDLSLSVNTEEMHLDPIEGKTKVMVYADGAWEVHIKEDADWLALDRTTGTGNGDLLFSYAQNFGVPRSVTLVIRKGNEVKEVKIIQQGINASFRFSKSKYAVPKSPFHVTLPILNDLKSNIENIKIEYLYDDETSEQWVSGVQLTDDGFEFDLLENNAGRNRTVRIYLTIIDDLDKEYTVFTDVDQSQAFPNLTQRKAESLLTKSAKMDTVIIKGNVSALFSEFEKTVTYEQGNDWIEQVELANDSLLIIAVRMNETGLERRANVNIKLVSNGTTYVDLTHKVIQTAQEYEYLTFDDVKGLITAASGTRTINAPLKVVEAFVVGDAGSMNMDTNPNTTFNSINFNETGNTSYIQNQSGTSGFRLKFVNRQANSLARYSKILLAVDGLTLVKESNPTRYTIRGIAAGNIIQAEPGTVSDLTVQTKAIVQLTDNDLYTFVKLKNVSVSVPYGAYANINMGYVAKTGVTPIPYWNPQNLNWNKDGAATPYTDAIPTTVYDDEGANLKVLVNAINSWSRDALPTGTGTLSGIVVYDKLFKYGTGEGDIGRYSIRPVAKNDVDLYGTLQPKTLVEWRMFASNNPNVAGTLTAGSGAVGYSAAEVAVGTVAAAKVRCTTGVNATLGANYTKHNDNGKLTANNAFQFNTKWWNTTTNKGEGVTFEFATTGITARALVLNFTQGAGSGGATSIYSPLYWEVAYSTNGTDYSLLPGSTYCVRPLPVWGQVYSEWLTPALNNFTFKLPTELLNKSKVYIRLQAQSNVCATSSGAENGRITATAKDGSNSLDIAHNVRFGSVSVKYIQ